MLKMSLTLFYSRNVCTNPKWKQLDKLYESIEKMCFYKFSINESIEFSMFALIQKTIFNVCVNECRNHSAFCWITGSNSSRKF